MIVIRNVFRLKFGKAREAVALFKEGIAIQKRVGAGSDFSTRLLTDVTGPFYTVVLEITVPNLAAFEGDAPRLMGQRLASQLSEDCAAGAVWVSRSLLAREVRRGQECWYGEGAPMPRWRTNNVERRPLTEYV